MITRTSTIVIPVAVISSLLAGCDGNRGGTPATPAAAPKAAAAPAVAVPPRAGVTMTYENLIGTDHTPAERPDGSPMPAAMARKMACQAGLVPIVLSGRSVPLDWGRARRFASPQQNDALRLQYETCTLFGCTASVEWCDAHHIAPFEPDGPTDLDNLTPACDHCHDLVHRPGWGVMKDRNGVVTSWAPDGQTWVHNPRDRRRRRRRHRPAQPQPAADPSTSNPFSSDRGRPREPGNTTMRCDRHDHQGGEERRGEGSGPGAGTFDPVRCAQRA